MSVWNVLMKCRTVPSMCECFVEAYKTLNLTNVTTCQLKCITDIGSKSFIKGQNCTFRAQVRTA